jgi:hypothetical protein
MSWDIVWASGRSVYIGQIINEVYVGWIASEKLIKGNHNLYMQIK